MKFCIRTDASPSIGMGHVMRCISIAQALSEMGVEITFVCSNSYPSQTITSYGFRIHVLNSSYEKMESEIDLLFDFINCYGIDGVLVDSYFATDLYLSVLQERLPVIYIDGLYRCNANVSGIINYNAAANIEEYQARFKGKNTALMIGLNFTPLRKEFRVGTVKKKINDELTSILITTGATDNYDVVKTLCRYWKQNRFFETIEKHVVIGKLFKEPEKLIEDFADDESFTFHINTTNMKSHMEAADIAISAAGTTVYELLSMQVPSIIFSLADVQNKVSVLAPSICWVGDIRDKVQTDLLSEDAAARITDAAKKLADSFQERKKLSELASQCVDGKGAERLAQGILEAIQK